MTDLPVTAATAALIARGGRGRWKIENEMFNVQKNGGYHLEHNFGHGSKHLSFVLFLLNLLAFFMHQIQILCDHAYRRVRLTFSFECDFWDLLRSMFHILPFGLMDVLLDEMYRDRVPEGG